MKSFLLILFLLIGLTSCLGIDSDCEAFDVKRLPYSPDLLKKNFAYTNGSDTIVLKNTSWRMSKALEAPILAPCEPEFIVSFEDADKEMSISYSWSYSPDESKDSIHLNIGLNSDYWSVPLRKNKFRDDFKILLSPTQRKSYRTIEALGVTQATLQDFIVTQISMTSGEKWKLIDASIK